MTTNIRMWVAAVTALAVLGLVFTSSLLCAAGRGPEERRHQDRRRPQEKGHGRRKKMAEAAAKNKKLIDEMTDLMHMFRPRNKGGHRRARRRSRTRRRTASKSSSATWPATFRAASTSKPSAWKMGYYIAALGELSDAAVSKAPVGGGKKTKKAWARNVHRHARPWHRLRQGLRGKGAEVIKTAADKVNANCNRCHSIFKD